MDWIDLALEEQRTAHRLRTPVVLEPESATCARVDGRRALIFCGNDYLGLRTHPRLAKAAHHAIDHLGTGAGASRLVSGHHRVHDEAEHELALLVHRPRALLTASGFAANAGTLPALVGADDVIVSDALNHASIVDGCRLARARTAVYAHADVETLARVVAQHRPFRRGWVVTESVFSMDGDLAPLPALRALCDREGLQLYVDDAHALGLWGPQGEGAATEIRTDVLIGTLGKALGCSGGFVAGSEALQLYLWNRCRSFVFSTAASPMVVAAAAEAARVVRSSVELRDKLQANLDRFRAGLETRGLPVTGHPRIPIVPLVVGADARAVALSERLLDHGVFIQAIRPPTVPPGTARLRITLSAAHSFDQIDQLLDALTRCL